MKNGITIWIKTWKKNKWNNSQKKPVANQDLWKELDVINNELLINWHWVKGHNSNFYNNLADRYAVKAMKDQTDLRLKNDDIKEI